MKIIDSIAAGKILARVATEMQKNTEIIAKEFSEKNNYPADSYVVRYGSIYYLPEGYTAGASWDETIKSDPSTVMMGTDGYDEESSVSLPSGVDGSYINYTDGSPIPKSLLSQHYSVRDVSIPHGAKSLTITGSAKGEPNAGYALYDDEGNYVTGGSLNSETGEAITAVIDPLPSEAKSFSFSWYGASSRGASYVHSIPGAYGIAKAQSDIADLKNALISLRQHLIEVKNALIGGDQQAAAAKLDECILDLNVLS